MASSAAASTYPVTMSRWLTRVLSEYQKDIEKITSAFSINPDESFVSGNHKKVIISTSEGRDIILGRPTKTGKFTIVQNGISRFGKAAARDILGKLNNKQRRFGNTTNSNSNTSRSSNVVHIGRKTRRSK